MVHHFLKLTLTTSFFPSILLPSVSWRQWGTCLTHESSLLQHKIIVRSAFYRSFDIKVPLINVPIRYVICWQHKIFQSISVHQITRRAKHEFFFCPIDVQSIEHLKHPDTLDISCKHYGVKLKTIFTFFFDNNSVVPWANLKGQVFMEFVDENNVQR